MHIRRWSLGAGLERTLTTHGKHYCVLFMTPPPLPPPITLSLDYFPMMTRESVQAAERKEALEARLKLRPRQSSLEYSIPPSESTDYAMAADLLPTPTKLRTDQGADNGGASGMRIQQEKHGQIACAGGIQYGYDAYSTVRVTSSAAGPLVFFSFFSFFLIFFTHAYTSHLVKLE